MQQEFLKMKCISQDPEIKAQSPDFLIEQQCDIPIPKEDQVLLRVLASSVNRLDLMQANGLYQIPPGITSIGGLDCVGYRVDPQTLLPYQEKVQICIALLSGGAYAQYAVCHKNHLINISSSFNVDINSLAAIPEVWITSYQLLKFVLQVEENASKVALIWAAASGVGTSLIQICKILGIKTIAVSSSQDKLDVCRALGSEFTINYKEIGSKNQFIDQVKNFTNNKGVDYILDPVFAQNFEINSGCLAQDSKWVVYGFLGGFKLENFNMQPLMKNRASLLTSTLRNRSDEYKSKLISEFREKCMNLFENQTLQLIIHMKFKYSQIGEAMKIVQDNQAIGKIILENDL